jgi:hypothetical protein
MDTGRSRRPTRFKPVANGEDGSRRLNRDR